MTTSETKIDAPPPGRRFSTIQFSLRRMLLAIALFAATLGLFTLYARRAGMFRPDIDPTWWWLSVTATAFGMSGMLLVGRRRDLVCVGNAIVSTIAGLSVAALLSASFGERLAWLIFIICGGRFGWLTFTVLGGLLGWFIGCLLFRWVRSPAAPPRKAERERPNCAGVRGVG